MTDEYRTPTPEDTARALAWIAQNNADGTYDDLLKRHDAGEIALGIISYSGKQLALMRNYRAYLGRQLEQASSYEIDPLRARIKNIDADIARAEALIASPTLYYSVKGVEAKTDR
jgi:hypothetical protein